MQKISESSVEVLYNGFESLGEYITEGFKRIEITKEPLWAIHSECRVWFHGFLSLLGVAVFAFMLYTKWGKS